MANEVQDSYLPAGFPPAEAEVVAQLRENIMNGTKTPHPPTRAELEVVLMVDYLGMDASALDPGAFWLNTPEERSVVFEALARAIAAEAS